MALLGAIDLNSGHPGFLEFASQIAGRLGDRVLLDHLAFPDVLTKLVMVNEHVRSSTEPFDESELDAVAEVTGTGSVLEAEGFSVSGWGLDEQAI